MRVISNERVYELVSQDEIMQAQLAVQREVEPQIKELIQLAEEGLHGLQKRERSLHEMVCKLEATFAAPLRLLTDSFQLHLRRQRTVNTSWRTRNKKLKRNRRWL